MLIRYGSAGAQVVELQEFLNKLPSQFPALETDGKYGPKTLVRVKELQATNKLAVDGVVGPNTMAIIVQLLKNLGGLVTPPPTPSNVSVRSITKAILGMEPTDGLIQQIFPPIGVVDVATFRAGDKNNSPSFSFSPGRTGRLGIFAAKKGNSERAVILVLPNGPADRIVLGVSHGFAQNTAFYEGLGWADPLSPPLIQNVLLKHVINRWGAQTLAGRKSMGLLHIVRAAGVELGPFAHDGAFVKEVLTQLVALTNNAFAFNSVEAFTFSSGISDFNPFLNALSGQLNVAAVYNIDPAKATPCVRPAGAAVKQFLSGQTGGPKAGFEFMPLERWKNEVAFMSHNVIGDFNYLHNLCMSSYALHLGIQTS